jgi:hypothetical protein
MNRFFGNAFSHFQINFPELFQSYLSHRIKIDFSYLRLSNGRQSRIVLNLFKRLSNESFDNI